MLEACPLQGRKRCIPPLPFLGIGAIQEIRIRWPFGKRHRLPTILAGTLRGT